MPSVIIASRWSEPIPGEDAKVAVLTEDESAILSIALSWVEEKAGQEWGDTIPRVDLHPTEASGGDLLSFKEAMSDVATTVRYDTGEGIYDEDCPAFKAAGVVRC